MGSTYFIKKNMFNGSVEQQKCQEENPSPLTHTVQCVEQKNCSPSHFSNSNCSHSMFFATLTAFLEIPSNESKLQLGECGFLHCKGFPSWLPAGHTQRQDIFWQMWPCLVAKVKPDVFHAVFTAIVWSCVWKWVIISVISFKCSLVCGTHCKWWGCSLCWFA